jgi:signal transduction histidine kinase
MIYVRKAPSFSDAMFKKHIPKMVEAGRNKDWEYKGVSLLVKTRLSRYYEISIATVTFIVLVIFGYVYLFEIPYLGFIFESGNGLVTVLYSGPNTSQTLLSGDFIVRVNGVDWIGTPLEDRHALLTELAGDAQIDLVIRRNGENSSASWMIPGVNITEFLYRLVSGWWLPLAFWLAGVATMLLIRPKEARWWLLFIFFYLIALAVSAGVISTYEFFYTPKILRSAIWMLLPISWHLHWLFPRSLGTPPKRILWLLYGLAVLMALAEWFGLLPVGSYLFGFLLILVNSLALLLLHAVVQPDERRSIVILLLGMSLIMLPSIVAVITTLMHAGFPTYINYSVLIFPGIAVAYFYVIYRGDAAGLELRANRLITVIIYSGILLAVAVILAFIATALLKNPQYYLATGIALTFLLGLMTVLIYPPFQQWVERRLLGIPLPPTQLLERYTTRMTASLGMDDLIHILRDEALPTMLIREAAILRLDSSQAPSLVFQMGVVNQDLPLQEQIPELLSQAGKYPRPDAGYDDRVICSWAYLILSLSVTGQNIGICLLGRRDPDDYYSKSDIRTLQALMDQTALALVNIDQAEQLRVLYQKDIERQELERSHLARELHDDVLNQLGMLWMSVDERQAGEQFAEAYQTSVTRIREIISGLRPGMLMYGLRFALEELTEETATQVGGDISILLQIPASDSRYPPDVELHLFRIVQQACQNALKHSKAQCIFLRGELNHGGVELVVEDDGIGFQSGGHLDLGRLLANKHYGLAGMHERAALIGAHMQIDSAPGRGTRVRVFWKTDIPGTPLRSQS